MKDINDNNMLFSWKEKNILVVEDDDVSALYLEEILEPTGVKYMIARTGDEAIKIFRENDFDLVLLDIQLPHKSGIEVAQNMKEINKNVHIIAQTAYAMSEDKKKFLRAGCDNYIAKPFEDQQLLELLSIYLD